MPPSGRHHSSASVSRAPAFAKPAGRVLGALLSASLLLASGWFWASYRSVDNGLTRLGGVRVGEAQPGVGTSPRPAKEQNILLVGNDDRSNLTRAEQEDLHVGPGQGSKATDTMMIVHLPADGSRATLLSLPRDSYVSIPGHGRGRLNSAFVTGYDSSPGSEQDKVTAGANLLIATVGRLTGLTIDHYAQIGLLGFYRIAKALNGVPVTLCADVRDPKSGFSATKGKHTLDGKRALQFVRQRYNFPNNGLGDLDRVKRQQYFLTAAFGKVASVGVLFQLRELGDALRTSLYLDPDFNTLDLARQVQSLSASKIRGATIPTSFATIDGQDVLRVEPAKVRAFVARQFGDAADSTPRPGGTATGTGTGSRPGSTPTVPARQPPAARGCTY